MTDLQPRPVAPTSGAAGARAARWSLLGLCMLAVTGCAEQDQVEHYKVAKPPLYRMLGAIIPRDTETWFFKVSGPDEELAKQADKFNELIRTLKFGEAGKPPSWKLPPGWRELPGDGVRIATILLGSAADALDLSVTTLPRHQEESLDNVLLANVGRWRNQLGLHQIDLKQMHEDVPKQVVNGVDVYRVELVGPKSGRTARRAMPADTPQLPPARPAANAPKFTAPEGWKAKPAGGFRVAAFEVSANGKEAEVVLSALGAQAGSLRANVERWCGQIGIKPPTDDELRRMVRLLPAGEHEAAYLDLGGADARQRMLVAILPHGGSTWFVKMTGPAELVGRQKENFEAFVKSLRFE